MDSRKPLEQYKQGDKYFFGGDTINVFDILHTKKVEINVNSMIKGLCGTPRWNAQTSTTTYVSEHTIEAMYMFREDYNTGGVTLNIVSPKTVELLILLHDCPEYVIGDISTPIKSLAPKIKKLENIILDNIYKKFYVKKYSHTLYHELVKKYDTKSLFAEWDRFYQVRSVYSSCTRREKQFAKVLYDTLVSYFVEKKIFSPKGSDAEILLNELYNIYLYGCI